MKVKCDYTLICHNGNFYEFSGSWFDVSDLEAAFAYMATLVSYGTKFKSIRFYFDEKGEE